ncbi:unnamed protein product [Hapterophycus canaliculatus]
MATDNKYDRQLRLWGGSGQKALMEANILLVNASATGTETLKNLVLPGVGRFTILDAEDVRPLDQGSNFFVGPEHVGLSRAKVTTELLCEMNPDVRGEYVCEDPDSQMNKGEAPASNKISTAPLPSVPPSPLSRALRGHCVVESKPEGNKPDLRISQPWPELLEYCRSMDLDKQV